MENVDSELQHISKSHENFMRDFIKIYKENRILWDKNHPKYKSRDNRDAAFDMIINKTSEYFPDANLDFVRTKIDSIRGAFRREHKKVLESKKKAKNERDVYVPSLWYYNLLLFIIGEENEVFDVNKKSSKHLYSWSKPHTIALIELLKKYPILYSTPPGSKTKRVKAYKDMTNELITETGRHFEMYEVKNKINILKQQFRRECRERENKKFKKSSSLWCYDLLTFLRDFSSSKKCESIIIEQEQIIDSDEDKKELWVRYETDADPKTKDDGETQDDIFDTIGKNVAIKLRDMSDDQRIWAENLINEIMYNGLMGNLNADSRISLTGDY